MLEMTFQLCYCCDWEVSAGAWKHFVLRCTGYHCSLQGAQVHLGLELFSFRALLFCLVFDCGMGCMSLSLLVKVWVLLKLQSIVFFYKVDCPLFLPFSSTVSHSFFLFSGPKIAWGSSDLKAL